MYQLMQLITAIEYHLRPNLDIIFSHAQYATTINSVQPQLINTTSTRQHAAIDLENMSASPCPCSINLSLLLNLAQ